MATIPIEIIIQDAESPVTPTPESGGETNITVPDTGTISSSGDTSSSASSIILPAIIAVLAMGAIVALLVHKYRKYQNDTLSKKEKLATVATSTIAILAATVLIGNLVIPATKAATDDTGSSSDEGTYLETEDKVTIVATIDKDSKEPTIVIVKDALYATTDASGYTVTMSMIEGALTSNLYLNGDESSEYYIAPVEVEDEDESEDTTEGVELATNTWGYRLSEDDGYLPVPVADTPATVAEGETAATREEIDVYYGLKVDDTLPLGTYSGEIEYNITPVNPIDKLTYMQDFASFSEEDKTKLLASMPEGEQYILKDKRDEKSYYISKLADGNMWMTQNLDLDVAEGAVFTPEYTDIEEDWTSEQASVDPGSVYYYTSNSDADDTQYNSLAECESDHNDGSCAHYHAGNYYTWITATAGGRHSEESSNESNSICPAGWKLPIGSGVWNEPYSEMADAIKSYSGILEDTLTKGCGGSCFYYRYLDGGLNTIRKNPLWLARAGMYYYTTPSGMGSSGYYWTNAFSGGTNANYTTIREDGVYPSKSEPWNSKGSIRCVAK